MYLPSIYSRFDTHKSQQRQQARSLLHKIIWIIYLKPAWLLASQPSSQLERARALTFTQSLRNRKFSTHKLPRLGWWWTHSAVRCCTYYIGRLKQAYTHTHFARQNETPVKKLPFFLHTIKAHSAKKTMHTECTKKRRRRKEKKIISKYLLPWCMMMARIELHFGIVFSSFLLDLSCSAGIKTRLGTAQLHLLQLYMRFT